MRLCELSLLQRVPHQTGGRVLLVKLPVMPGAHTGCVQCLVFCGASGGTRPRVVYPATCTNHHHAGVGMQVEATSSQAVGTFSGPLTLVPWVCGGGILVKPNLVGGPSVCPAFPALVRGYHNSVCTACLGRGNPVVWESNKGPFEGHHHHHALGRRPRRPGMMSLG